jgi:hypothetical protein
MAGWAPRLVCTLRVGGWVGPRAGLYSKDRWLGGAQGRSVRYGKKAGRAPGLACTLRVGGWVGPRAGLYAKDRWLGGPQGWSVR